jgi:hypothetical protein
MLVPLPLADADAPIDEDDQTTAHTSTVGRATEWPEKSPGHGGAEPFTRLRFAIVKEHAALAAGHTVEELCRKVKRRMEFFRASGSSAMGAKRSPLSAVTSGRVWTCAPCPVSCALTVIPTDARLASVVAVFLPLRFPLCRL